jgi:hypothetical protein
VRGSTMTMNDPAELFKSLRVSTCALLSYDADHLTAAQQIRLDRAITLRLIVDDLQARQMRGEVIDAKSFVSASEDLERLCGGQPEQTTTAHDFTGAKEELTRLLDRRADAIERRDEKLRDEIAAREEMAAVAAASFEPVPIPPSPAVPPDLPRPNNVIPIGDATERANSNLPPLHYLKDGQAKEPWERYYDGRSTGPHFWPLPR